MLSIIESRHKPSAPFWANGFRLVCLKELLMQYAEDEFQFGPFANLSYALGALDDVADNQNNLAHIVAMLEVCHGNMERFGFYVSARNTQELIDMLRGIHPGPNLPVVIPALRQSLMIELESTVFLPVEPLKARFYREPRREWEEIINRFADTVSDIEESNKCYALGRYAASVFHSTQVLEHGLLALGIFMQIPDPKSGITAVAKALQRITNKNYDDLTEFEKSNFPFFEQMNGSVQAIKDAWRNKISHAQGKAVLMTADFSPAVAMEIILATRGFMRRLATELPS